MKEGEYYGTHWFWDSEDREYTLCAKWFFEKNYPEMPDQWILLDLEVEDQEPSAPDLDVSENSNVWRGVEKDGPPMDVQEVDYV
jgi:hypothetical protein